MQKILATLDEFFTVDFWHSGNNHELVSDGVDGVDVKLGHSGIHGDQEKRHELDHLDKIVRVTNFIMPTQVNAFVLLSLPIFVSGACLGGFSSGGAWKAKGIGFYDIQFDEIENLHSFISTRIMEKR